MEFFFGLVGLMVILALIRVWRGSGASKDQSPGTSESVHYWTSHEAGSSHGGGGSEGGGSSFDGGGSDGGGGGSSSF